MPTPRSPFRLAAATSVIVLATSLAACSTPPHEQTGSEPSTSTSGKPTGKSKPSGPTTSEAPTPDADPVKLTANVDDGAEKVKVSTVVAVKAAAGTLTQVKLSYTTTDRNGQKVKGRVDGELSKDRATWTAGDRLEPDAKYRLEMVGEASGDAAAKTVKSSFSTQSLTLAQQTFPAFFAYNGREVGVGMPVILYFDVAVDNRKEFEKHLSVTSSPQQTGSWHWLSDKEVHYRPAKYWKAGTEVTVHADLNGVSAGNGVYGQKSTSASFHVGRSLVTKVNLATDVAKVYRNGEMVRKISVSGGKPGWQTRSGTKLIMGTEYNKKMTNEMIGAKEDYSLVAKYAMRITNSGEFLHSAPWNGANFGVRNASHGCVGMSNADAGWLYERVRIGDPVETTGSSRGVEQGNGWADWNLSYSEYKKGSAL